MSSSLIAASWQLLVDKIKHAIDTRDLVTLDLYLKKVFMYPGVLDNNFKNTIILRLASTGFVEGLRSFENLGHLNFDDADDRLTTPLMYAASNGHVSTVIFLLQQGAKATRMSRRAGNPIAQFSLGDNPLHYALFYLIDQKEKPTIDMVRNCKTIIQLLLKFDADPNTLDNLRFTPLGLIVKYQLGMEILGIFLNNPKIKLNPSNEMDAAAICYALYDANIISQLTKRKEFKINEPNYLGEVLLTRALAEGLWASAAVLLEAGADPYPALERMLSVDNFEHAIKCLKFLIDSKSQQMKDLLTNRGMEIFIKIAMHHSHLMDYFPEPMGDPFVKYGDVRGIEVFSALPKVDYLERCLLREYPINPSDKLEILQKCLLVAIESGKMNNVKRLLALDLALDINFINEKQQFPLLQAAVSGEDEILDYLLDNNAKINQTTLEGATAVIGAALNGCASTIIKLQKRGADLSLQSKRKMTALHAACQNGHIDCVQVLLENDVSCNTRCERGFTPLVTAAHFGHADIVKLICIHSKELLNTTYSGLDLLEYTTSPETAKVLQGLGMKSFPFLCYTQMIKLAVSLSNESSKSSHETLEQYLSLFNLNTNGNILSKYDFIYRGRVEVFNFPLFVFSNACSIQVRSLFLKYLLCGNFPDLKVHAAPFVNNLRKNCLDFKFGNDGSLCITLQKREVVYNLTLSQKSIAILLEQPMSDDAQFAALLSKYSDEAEALQKEEDHRALKDKALLLIAKSCRELDDYKTKLLLLKKQATQKNEENLLTKTKEIEEACLQNLDDITNISAKIKSKGLLYVVDDKITTETERKILEEINRKSLEEVVVELETLAERCKSKIEKPFQEVRQGIETLEMPVSTQGACASTKSEKRRKKKAKALEAKVAVEEKASKEAAAALSAIDTKETSDAVPIADKTVAALVKEIEGESIKVKTQKTTVIPKIKPTIMSRDHVSKLVKSYNSLASFDNDSRQYLTVPKFTMERALGGLGSQLWAHDRLKSIQQTASVAIVASSISSTLIDYVATKGALAQAFEARKELNEEWPNTVRNVLFRCEEALDKLMTEQEVIRTVSIVVQNMQNIPVSQLIGQGSKLDAKTIDEKNFLQNLLQVTIPAYELSRAKQMIQRSETELKYYREFIQKHGEKMLNNKNLNLAIGFSLARIGTYASDMCKNHHSVETKYLKLLEMGREYRHDDPVWQTSVDSFIQECLLQGLKQRGLLPAFNQTRISTSGESAGFAGPTDLAVMSQDAPGDSKQRHQQPKYESKPA